MTPREFREAVKGHDLAWEQIDRRLAWAVGNIMSPHIKRRGGLLKKLWGSIRGKKQVVNAAALDEMLDPKGAAKAKAQAVIDKIRAQREGDNGPSRFTVR